MGFSLKMGYTGKRINSTSQIWQQTDEQKIVLKEGTSISDPVFIISRNYTPINNGKSDVKPDQAFASFNYCYCAELKRYYWIDNVIIQGGATGGSGNFVELHCHVDVLASFRDIIYETTPLVMFCGDVKFSNMEIDDGRLAPEVPIQANPVGLLDSNPYFTGSGVFVFKCTAMAAAASLKCTYVMTPGNYGAMVAGFLNNYSQSASGVKDADSFCKWIVNSLGGMGNVSEYINGVYFVPVDYGKFTQSEEDVCIANINTGVKGKLYLADEEIDKLNYTKTLSSLPVSVQGSINDGIYHFLNGTKYTSIGLKGPDGSIDISSDAFVEADAKKDITVKWVFNYLKGDWVVEIWKQDTGDYLGRMAGNVAIPFGDLVTGEGSGSIYSNYIGKALSIAGSAIQTGIGLGITADANQMAFIQKSEFASDAQKQTAYNKVSSHQAGLKAISSGVGGLFSFSQHSINASGGGGNSSADGYINAIISMMDMTGTGGHTNFMVQVTMSTCYPAVCTSAGQASMINYGEYVKLHGYPCNQIIPLTSIADGNYVQCSKANCETGRASAGNGNQGMLLSEISEVNTYLNTGFYKEA